MSANPCFLRWSGYGAELHGLYQRCLHEPVHGQSSIPYVDGVTKFAPPQFLADISCLHASRYRSSGGLVPECGFTLPWCHGSVQGSEPEPPNPLALDLCGGYSQQRYQPDPRSGSLRQCRGLSGNLGGFQFCRGRYLGGSGCRSRLEWFDRILGYLDAPLPGTSPAIFDGGLAPWWFVQWTWVGYVGAL